MERMNFGNFLFLALILSFSINCWAKSKLGEYYYGFGYSLVETDKGKKQEGDFLRLSAYGPNDSESDLSVHLDYGSVESNASDVTSLGIGINYLVHFEDLTGSNSPIHPFIGIGISYLDEEAPILLAEDGFTWSMFVGSEFKINRSISAYLGGKISQPSFYLFWALWIGTFPGCFPCLPDEFGCACRTVVREFERYTTD